MSALYPEVITAWRGIPQGYVVDEFLRLDEHSAGHGYLLMPTFAFPVAAASVLPGYGEQHRQLMELYPRLGAIGISLHDHSRGRLEFSEDAPPTVTYRLGAVDQEQLLDAMVQASELSFAAGAEKVFLPYNDIVTMGLALSNEGKPVPSLAGSYSGLIPKGAKNVTVAKEFLKFLIQPKVVGELLKTGLGRRAPAMPSIVKDDP